MFLKKDNQFSVECLTKIATDCLQMGEYCDNEKEALEWVEEECWIFSGEGWICIKCNEHFMRNLVKKRRDKKNDDRGEDLYVGIETVR